LKLLVTMLLVTMLLVTLKKIEHLILIARIKVIIKLNWLRSTNYLGLNNSERGVTPFY